VVSFGLGALHPVCSMQEWCPSRQRLAVRWSLSSPCIVPGRTSVTFSAVSALQKLTPFLRRPILTVNHIVDISGAPDPGRSGAETAKPVQVRRWRATVSWHA